MPRRAAPLCLLWFLTFGCAQDQPPFGSKESTGWRTPTTDTGVRATVIMPGQTAPPLGSAGAGGGNFSTLGGATSNEESYRKHGSENLPQNRALNTAGGAVAAPFKKAWEVVGGGDDDDEPETDPQAAAPRPLTRAEVQALEEQQRIEAMRREVERQHGSQASGPAPAPAPTAAPASRPAPGRAAPSIAEELAAMQARWQPREDPARETRYQPGPRVSRAPAPREGPVADHVEDRNGDGRPDHWTYLRSGRPDREIFDEDGDGAADRTIRYEAQSGQPSDTEEDTDRDGRVDAFSHYDGGQLKRRRVDTSGDGFIDRWIYYQGGKLAREEEDSTGDGFRDRVAFYEGGRLVRREEDRDADGRADVISRYDSEEKLAFREEDRDGDGRPDVRSLYENGRLARREILNDAALGTGPDGAAEAVELPSLESLRFRE